MKIWEEETAVSRCRIDNREDASGGLLREKGCGDSGPLQAIHNLARLTQLKKKRIKQEYHEIKGNHSSKQNDLSCSQPRNSHEADRRHEWSPSGTKV